MSAATDQINIATFEAYDDTVLNDELLSRECSSLRRLQEKSKHKTGSPIKIKIRYKRNNGGSYSGYDKFDTDQVEQIAEGSLEWKNVYVNVTVDEDTLVENANMNLTDVENLKELKSLPASDQKTILNLFGQAMDDSIVDMRHLQATQLHAASPGSKDIESLVTVIDGAGDSSNGPFGNANGSYAGINYNSSTLGQHEWKSEALGSKPYLWESIISENGGTNRSLDHDILSKILNDITVSVIGDDSLDAYCGRAAYRAIALLLEQEKTRPNANVTEIGFRQNFTWEPYGITFIKDGYVDVNAMRMINHDHLKLYQHPALENQFGGFKEPTDQAAITGQLKNKWQIWCDDRTKQAAVLDVQP